MPDDTKIPDPTLPPGLSSVPSEPPAGGVPIVPPVAAKPQPIESPAADIPSYRPVDVSAIVGAKEPPAVNEDSALKDLAKSLHDTPPTPVVPPAAEAGVPAVSVNTPTTDLPPQVPAGSKPPPKKSGGKKSAIIGALFLLVVLPIIGYYVAQKTDITRIIQFAGTGIVEKEGKDCSNIECGPNGQCLSRFGCGGCCRGPTKPPPPPPTFTVTPTVTVTPTSTPPITVTVTPTLTETPTPTNPPSQPGVCDASCDNDNSCRSGLVCSTNDGIKRCRNPQCTSEYTCVCPATGTPTPTTKIGVTATPSPIAAAPTPKVPVSGAPAVLGAATVAGGILLLLLGLLL